MKKPTENWSLRDPETAKSKDICTAQSYFWSYWRGLNLDFEDYIHSNTVKICLKWMIIKNKYY